MDIKFNKNEDKNKLKLIELKNRLEKTYLGGGEKRIEKLHSQGKMTARERIDFLLDDKDEAIEIGAFAADGMYEEVGGCPSAGVVVKIGKVSGKSCIIVANDATDRKSTRLNSSHVAISYAVFCLKKKNKLATVSHI